MAKKPQHLPDWVWTEYQQLPFEVGEREAQQFEKVIRCQQNKIVWSCLYKHRENFKFKYEARCQVPCPGSLAPLLRTIGRSANGVPPHEKFSQPEMRKKAEKIAKLVRALLDEVESIGLLDAEDPLDEFQSSPNAIRNVLQSVNGIVEWWALEKPPITALAGANSRRNYFIVELTGYFISWYERPLYAVTAALTNSLFACELDAKDAAKVSGRAPHFREAR